MMPRALATSPDTDVENFALQVKKKKNPGDSRVHDKSITIRQAGD